MTDQPRPHWAERIEAERRSRGWGPFKTARRLYAAVGIDDPDMSQVKSLYRQINRHEKGLVFPADWGSAYATIFEMEEKDLFGEESTDQPAGTVHHGPIPDEGDDVKRRTALQLLAALAAGTAIPPGVLDEILSSVDRVLDQPVDVAEWELAVREYGFLINQQPVGSLINDLVADIFGVGELLERDKAHRADHLRISAGLSALLAIELGDIGERRGARMAWRTARRAADASGDRDLKVWTRAREAEEGFWYGLPRQEITARTAEAMHIADGAPCGGLPRAYSVRASVAAEQGDKATARKAMDDLSRLFDGLPDSVTGDPVTFGWSEARLRWNEAYVYTLIGDKRANRALDDAIDLYPPGTLGPVANLMIIRAMGAINNGDIDTGLDQTRVILQDIPISPCRRHMTTQILHRLPEWARPLPEARELRTLTSSRV
ncbi:XRE family transcriptional regulator [Actinomadura spongiicola]|uniref:XRE family transcriptional regulator n=1 Tax=Actinomadura spongiicola TaxID=2303421 RepID=A0A372G8W0_9ACTN|nr:XRE family transcriptional regulator [Actinomadura spongiicola]RFS81826.1 XRE family transcriptional regulator [Actinomadura spongiicola]